MEAVSSAAESMMGVSMVVESMVAVSMVVESMAAVSMVVESTVVVVLSALESPMAQANAGIGARLRRVKPTAARRCTNQRHLLVPSHSTAHKSVPHAHVSMGPPQPVPTTTSVLASTSVASTGVWENTCANLPLSSITISPSKGGYRK